MSRWKYTGTPIERFWEKVDKRGPDECWPWLASKDDGYGQYGVNRKTVRAHRFAYELLVGPVHPWLTLDHLCENPACVNPAHLEPVPAGVNKARSSRESRRTHCPQGHPYDAENTRWCRGGKRQCRACTNARLRGLRARRTAEAEMRAKEFEGDPRFAPGTRWKWLDRRRAGRTVEVLEHYSVGDRFRVRNVATGVRTTVRRQTLLERYRPTA